jgi:hypothetical protein
MGCFLGEAWCAWIAVQEATLVLSQPTPIHAAPPPPSMLLPSAPLLSPP